MKYSENYYPDLGGNRIVPESPLEADVIRQAILADKWDLAPEQRSGRGTPWPLSHRVGGQAVFHPEWSPTHTIHYALGDHLQDGFYELKVNIYGQRLVASFLLTAALLFESKPWFQTVWEGYRRNMWLCPWWFLIEQRANPVGLQLKVRDAKGVLMIGSLSTTMAEGECLPPHVVLVDPRSIKAE